MNNSERQINLLALYAIFTVTVIVFFRYFTNDILDWKDREIILSLGNLNRHFSLSVLFNFSFAFPLTKLLLVKVYSLSGTAGFLFHLIQIIVHSLNGFLLFLLLRRLNIAVAVSVISALLFCVHPLQIQSVVWISNVGMVISTLFLFLAAISYVDYFHHRAAAKIIFMLLFLLLASLWNPTGFIGFLISLYVVFHKKLFYSFSRWQKLTVVLMLSAMGLMLIQQIAALQGDSVWKLCTDSFEMLRLGLVHFLLHLFYFWNVTGIPAIEYSSVYVYILPVLLVSGIFSIFFFSDVTKKYFIAGLALYIFSLPVFRIDTLAYNNTINDANYLGFVAVTITCALLLNKWKNAANRIFLACIGILLLALSLQTFFSAGVWKNSLSVWNALLEKNPNTSLLYQNRGDSYVQSARYKDALSDFNAAIQQDSSNVSAFMNRGVLYLTLGKFSEADNDFRATLRRDSTNAAAYFNIAVVFNNTGMNDSVLQYFDYALHYQPNFAQVFNNRGNFYLRGGKFVEALADYNKALEIEPTYFEALGNKAILYLQINDPKSAILNFNAQLALNPRRIDICILSGLSHLIIQDSINAKNLLKKAVEFDSTNSRLYFRSVYGLFFKDSTEHKIDSFIE